MKPLLAIAVLCTLLGACSFKSTTIERPVAQPAPAAIVVPEGTTATVVTTPG